MLREPFRADCRMPEWSYKLNMATVDAALCVSLLWLLYLMRTFHWFGLKSVSLCTLTTCWQRLQPTRIDCIKAYRVSGFRKKCKKTCILSLGLQGPPEIWLQKDVKVQAVNTKRSTKLRTIPYITNGFALNC